MKTRLHRDLCKLNYSPWCNDPAVELDNPAISTQATIIAAIPVETRGEMDDVGEFAPVLHCLSVSLSPYFLLFVRFASSTNARILWIPSTALVIYIQAYNLQLHKVSEQLPR